VAINYKTSRGDLLLLEINERIGEFIWCVPSDYDIISDERFVRDGAIE
jgi:hypothetical protein